MKSAAAFALLTAGKTLHNKHTCELMLEYGQALLVLHDSAFEGMRVMRLLIQKFASASGHSPSLPVDCAILPPLLVTSGYFRSRA